METNLRDKKYNSWARRQPAYISLTIPFLYFMLIFHDFESELSDIKYVISILISMAGIMSSLFFMYSFLIRDIAKLYPERVMFGLVGKPTTILLCDESSSFSLERKTNIILKLKSMSIQLDLFNNHSKKK